MIILRNTMTLCTRCFQEEVDNETDGIDVDNWISSDEEPDDSIDGSVLGVDEDPLEPEPESEPVPQEAETNKRRRCSDEAVIDLTEDQANHAIVDLTLVDDDEEKHIHQPPSPLPCSNGLRESQSFDDHENGEVEGESTCELAEHADVAGFQIEEVEGEEYADDFEISPTLSWVAKK